MNRFLQCLLSLAGLVIVIQCWVFLIISEWIVDDSYALMHFPKAHPVLGFFVELAWNIGTFGGRYVLIFLALVLLLWLVRSLLKKRVHEKCP